MMMTNKMVKLPSVSWWLYCVRVFCRAALTLGSKQGGGTSLRAAKPHEFCWTQAVSGGDSQDDMSSVRPSELGPGASWITLASNLKITRAFFVTVVQSLQCRGCCHLHVPNQLMKHLTAASPLSPLAELENWNKCGGIGVGFTFRLTKRISSPCPVSEPVGWFSISKNARG